jgi:ubiquinone/menaquinone biosynthesis C-methylase UbiE
MGVWAYWRIGVSAYGRVGVCILGAGWKGRCLQRPRYHAIEMIFSLGIIAPPLLRWTSLRFNLCSMVLPTERFSDRVDSYAKHRPSYPEALLNFLKQQVPVPAAVADIGSGTGILTELLLQTGYEVYGVEPNAPMRAAAEKQLEHHALFHTVDGSAESTSLSDHSVDLITAAQAFHWFDRAPAKDEFRRILKANGKVVLIWNERLDDASEVNRRYESVLKEMVPGYPTVARHRMVRQEDIHEFFAPNQLEVVTFRNDQKMDRAGLIGRLLSTSYVPNTGQPGNIEIVSAVDRIFDDCQADDVVTMVYETRVYFGTFGS